MHIAFFRLPTDALLYRGTNRYLDSPRLSYAAQNLRNESERRRQKHRSGFPVPDTHLTAGHSHVLQKFEFVEWGHSPIATIRDVSKPHKRNWREKVTTDGS